MDEELRRELLARRDEDQRIRALLRPQGQHAARVPEEVAAQWRRIDEDNTRWLGEVLGARGWPGRTLTGEDGAAAAWLLAQHADRDPVRQRGFLDALRGAVGQGEASPAHLAYLEDRVRVNAGRPQLYGTQFTVTGGHLAPHPVEDPQRLDERRAEAGLEPFADYHARMRALLSRALTPLARTLMQPVPDRTHMTAFGEFGGREAMGPKGRGKPGGVIHRHRTAGPGPSGAARIAV